MKTIQIDGVDVNVSEVFTFQDSVEIIADVSFSEALQYEGKTFTVGGKNYPTTAMQSLNKNGFNLTVAMYTRRSEADDLREEIAEKDGIIDRIRSSISDLGSGVPTLSKLKTFLEAVKEAIHYE